MKSSEYVSLMKEVRESFVKQLTDMNKARPGSFKPKQLQDMAAGCSDGARMALLMAVDKGYLTIEED